MFFGIRQLQRAADLLEAASAPGDPAVPEAILSFLSACACRRDWPEPFQARAFEISRLMTAGGTPQATADGLDVEGLAAIQEKVTRFVADAEAAVVPAAGRLPS